MKGQIHTEYYIVCVYGGEIGGVLFLTKRKSHFSTWCKGICAYKDHPDAKFEGFRNVQPYNMIEISWESEEKDKTTHSI